MSKPYVLTVDDEPEVLGTLGRALRREGYDVGRAYSGEEALRMLAERLPDLIILDIIMPGLSGLEVCRRIRANEAYGTLPILFLTAKNRTEDIVAGLDAGGDDYITKPFELAELTARVRALIRRNLRHAVLESPILVVGALRLDSNTHQVKVGDSASAQLTATEHRLLRYLMEHANQALSPQHLLEAVWDYPPDTGDPDLVRAHVRNLRAKLKKLDPNATFIRTIHGVGYMVGE